MALRRTPIFTGFLQGRRRFLPYFFLRSLRLVIRGGDLLPLPWSDEMTIWMLLGGLGALALAAYLLYALLNAEKF